MEGLEAQNWTRWRVRTGASFNGKRLTKDGVKQVAVCSHFFSFAHLRPPDPLRELNGIGRGGTEKDQPNVLRKHDDHFLPHHPPLGIVDVMNLVENDPLNVPDHVGAAVQHRAEDLGGHDKARGGGIDLHVAGDQADVFAEPVPSVLV